MNQLGIATLVERTSLAEQLQLNEPTLRVTLETVNQLGRSTLAE